MCFSSSSLCQGKGKRHRFSLLSLGKRHVFFLSSLGFFCDNSVLNVISPVLFYSISDCPFGDSHEVRYSVNRYIFVNSACLKCHFECFFSLLFAAFFVLLIGLRCTFPRRFFALRHCVF